MQHHLQRPRLIESIFWSLVMMALVILACYISWSTYGTSLDVKACERQGKVATVTNQMEDGSYVLVDCSPPTTKPPPLAGN